MKSSSYTLDQGVVGTVYAYKGMKSGTVAKRKQHNTFLHSDCNCSNRDVYENSYVYGGLPAACAHVYFTRHVVDTQGWTLCIHSSTADLLYQLLYEYN